MVRFQHLLYPTDLSEASLKALHYATAIARWYDARLTVLHVVPTFDPIQVASDRIGTAGPVVYPPTRDEVVAEMKRALGEGALEGITADLVPAEGNAATIIVEQALATAANLVVMGTHGRSGFDHLLSGSVTERVIRKAPCPVLTVPPTVRSADDAEGVFKRILCAVDFSPSSQQALGFALDLARQSGGTLAVLNVIEWLADEESRVHEHYNVREFRQHLVDDTRERLRGLLDGEPRTWCEIEEIVGMGSSHREVLRVAGEKHSDLIVMGAQGRGGLGLALFGSTTVQIMRAATCPVLVVRSASAST